MKANIILQAQDKRNEATKPKRPRKKKIVYTTDLYIRKEAYICLNIEIRKQWLKSVE